ncbi:MAG: AAA family ATPase [Polyangia bacterium]
MNVKTVNEHLFRGEIDVSGLFPHLEQLKRQPLVFGFDFGLDHLPEEPGILIIRGARQYGKSTWIEARLRDSVERFGPASAFYLNGDEISDSDSLAESILELVRSYPPRAPVRRLFIDEITAVDDWQRALKRLVDRGELRDVLVVTTGSKATDLRRGAELLPGRKGRLARTFYLFTPISYFEFRRVCGEDLKERTLPAYLLAGGCPVACAEIAAHGSLPEYVPTMVRDWIRGEFAASGRQRSSLLVVMEKLHSFGGTPLGQAKLARESGLANNTVAAGYVELLADLMCVGIASAWDESRRVTLTRRPAKYHLINLLAAAAWDPSSPRSVDDFEALPSTVRGRWWEWLAAQEIWRRAAIAGDETPERMAYWKSRSHELDFVLDAGRFVEIKSGRTSPLELGWFAESFPRGRLTVVGRDRFETERIRGVTMEDFLLEEW